MEEEDRLAAEAQEVAAEVIDCVAPNLPSRWR